MPAQDEEKLRYAAYLLSGPAEVWWESMLAIQTPGTTITWEQFKEKFRETHVPESIMELKRREFENLRQNDMLVLRYVRDFSILSRYATDEVNTDEKWQKCCFVPYYLQTIYRVAFSEGIAIG